MGVMRRWILILLVMAMAGSALALVVMQESDTSVLPGIEELTAELEGVVEPLNPAWVDVRSAGNLDSEVDSPEAEFERSEVHVDADVANVGPTGPFVRVVDALTKSPVAGARVRFVELDLGQREHRKRGDGRKIGVYELADRYGEEWLADEDGILRLPRAKRRMIIAASHEGRYGTGQVDRQKPRKWIRIELALDETVSFSVVEVDGKPAASVPLAVQCLRGKRRHVVWRGETGLGGNVTVAHFQVYRRRSTVGSRYSVGFALPLLQPVGVAIPDNPLPEDPLVLTLPATGRVEVSMRHLGDLPVRSKARVSLRVVRAKKDRGPRFDQQAFTTRIDTLSLSKSVGDQKLVFERVGLGVAFKVSAEASKMTFPSLVARGPVTPDQLVSVVLVGASNQALVIGRVLDPEGHPLVNQKIGFTFLAVDRSVGYRSVHTDEEGRIEMMLKVPKTGPTHLRAELRTHEGGAALLVPAPALVAGRVSQLGDLILRPLPLFAKGYVIDDRGQALDRASLRVEREETRPGKGTRWVREPGLTIVRGKGGAFQIRGEAGFGALRIRARRGGHLESNDTYLSAGLDVEIKLVREGMILGNLLLDPWVAAGGLSITLEPSDPGQKMREIKVSKGSVRRSFRFDKLTAGSYAVGVRVVGEGTLLARIPGLVIEPGTRLRDPRLLRLDLRGRMQRIQIGVFDDAGRYVRNAKLVVLNEKSYRKGDRGRSVGVSRGRLDLVTSAHAVDLYVTAKGFRSQIVRNAVGKMRVTLASAPRVVLRVTAKARKIGSPLRWFAMLRAHKPKGSALALAKVSKQYKELLGKKKIKPLRIVSGIDSRGRAQFDVPAPGSYRVDFYVYRKGRKQPARIRTKKVVIAPETGRKGARMEIDTKAFDKAMRELGMQAK